MAEFIDEIHVHTKDELAGFVKNVSRASLTLNMHWDQLPVEAVEDAAPCIGMPVTWTGMEVAPDGQTTIEAVRREGNTVTLTLANGMILTYEVDRG